MPTKLRIIEQIGAKGLLLPELINRGLAANDRLKYYLALLQTASAHAAAPNQPTADLREEREASGIEDEALDEVVPASRAAAPGTYLIPHAAHVFECMALDLLCMLEPLRVAVASEPELRDRLDAYDRRVTDRIGQLPRGDDDHVPSSALEALTRRAANGHDSLHQLVMDLHWELNHLHASVSVDSIDGARAYGLDDNDRALVRAFMKGVNTTSMLKFDHDGLGTTAMRDGTRLAIQNDLGTDDVHVVVIHVSGLEATLIYTDAHRARAAFLQHMLEPHHVQWSSAPVVDGGGYEMRVGRYTGATRDDLERYLTFLGTRLVFLIDWNRARKRLGRFVKAADASMVLKWAADNDIGHRGFLQAGGARLIYTALERAAPRQLRVGMRLDDLLGRDSACAFLMSVLSIASAGIAGRRSTRLVDDEIEAELLTHLETTDQAVLTAVADHAGVVAALSDRLRNVLIHLKGNGGGEANGTADMAKVWERRAADIIQRAVRLLAQCGDGHDLRRLLNEADAVAPALEKAAFRLTLVPSHVDPHGVALLDDLADLVSQSARDYVRCIEDARDIRRTPTRSDLERFLVAVDRLTDLEHQGNAAERAIEGTLMHGSGDFRQVHALSGVARSFQQAIGSLARCSDIIRDYVLSTTAGGK
jgi:hypothetical protein